MTRSKTIRGKKSIFGPSYLVMEDVPIYFLGIPFGFFPMTEGRTSGILTPTYGEEAAKGFFLRNGGYYWAINDYIDLALQEVSTPTARGRRRSPRSMSSAIATEDHSVPSTLKTFWDKRETLTM